MTIQRLKQALFARPPHIYPGGIETPRTLPNLTAGLLKRGYTEENVRKIMGLNLLRVYKDVWS